MGDTFDKMDLLAGSSDTNTSLNGNDIEPVYTPPSSTTSTTSDSTASMKLVKDANISVRKYIYILPWPLPDNTPVPFSTNIPTPNPLGPATPSEPTSTLVLTSPRSTFVDLRFFKPLESSPSNNQSDTLEWGFAGHSESRPKSEPGVSHSTWTHFVDSRFPVGAETPVDEGDMYTISEKLTLEYGHAFHPHYKAVKSHEEMWEDEDILTTSTSSDTAEAEKVCTVLRLQDDAKGVRGIVIRLGQYIQGIVVAGDEVSAERFEYSKENDWQRTKRVGKHLLPCAILKRQLVLAVGGTVRYKEFEWTVEEVWKWQTEPVEGEEKEG
jgi:hypothetical protein